MAGIEISEEELKAIEAYQGIYYRLFNTILEVDTSEQAGFVKGGIIGPETFNRSDIEKMILNVKLVYSAMLKYFKQNGKPLCYIKRGTSQSEIDRIIRNGGANKFISTSYTNHSADNAVVDRFSLGYDDPAIINIEIDDEVPFLDVEDLIGDSGGEHELLLSPFLDFDIEYRGKNIKDCITGKKEQTIYDANVKKRELLEVDKPEELRESILSNAEEISKKQESYFKLQKKLEDNEFAISCIEPNIEEARERLNMARNDYERRNAEDDIEYLSGERRQELESEREKLIEESNALKSEIEAWKKDVARLCMSECREVELEFPKLVEEQKKLEEERVTKIRIDEKKEQIRNNGYYIKEYDTGLKMKINTLETESKRLVKFRDSLKDCSKRMGITYDSVIEPLRDVPAVISNLTGIMEKFFDVPDISMSDSEQSLDENLKKQREIKVTGEKALSMSKSISELPVEQTEGFEENLFKGSIYNTVMRMKLDIYSDLLRKESSELNQAKGVKKLWNKLVGIEKKEITRKEEIEEALKAISMEKVNFSKVDPNERYSIREIMAEINSILARYGNNREYADITEKLSRISSEICSMYTFDKEDVERRSKDKTSMIISQDGKVKETDLILKETKKIGHRIANKIAGPNYTGVRDRLQEISDVMRKALNDRQKGHEHSNDMDKTFEL